MSLVLGIDPSSNKLGWARYDPGRDVLVRGDLAVFRGDLNALIAQRDASLQQAGAFPCQCCGDLTCTACCVSAGLHDERTYWADLLAGEVASQWAEAAS